MTEETDSGDTRLLPADAEAVGIVVAQLADANLPLGEGLIAVAQEVRSRRLVKGLRRLGHTIQQGASLAEALQVHRGMLPPALAATLAAAEHSGRLGPVLAEWTENQLAAQARSRQVSQALTYPALCLALALLLLSFVGWYVLPAFDQMFREFELRIPSQTLVVLWLGRMAFPILVAVAGAIALLLLLLRLVGGRVGWNWCLTQTPLLGKLWHWTGVAEALRMLAILVEQHMPLAEALRLTGQSARDAYVGRSLQQLASRVAGGARFSASLEDDGRLPRSLAPLLRTGEHSGLLADGLRDAAAMLEQRVAAQCDLVTTVLPPLVFLVIGFVLLTVIGALFGPLVQLIQGLSF